MAKIIGIILAIVINFGAIGWLINEKVNNAVTIADQSRSIKNAKKTIEEKDELYAKKLKEFSEAEKINKRMRDEIDRIKKKINNMGVGDSFDFRI